MRKLLNNFMIIICIQVVDRFWWIFHILNRNGTVVDQKKISILVKKNNCPVMLYKITINVHFVAPPFGKLFIYCHLASSGVGF